MNFETSVRIARPIDEVFAFVSDPDNFPQWNSAVQAVRRTSEGEGGGGSTYSMERVLPSGRAQNALEIVAWERPNEFAIRTTSGPTPFVYRYRLSSENGVTVVRLDAQVEVEGALALPGPLARRAIKKGVEDNFGTLKRILEGHIASREGPAGRKTALPRASIGRGPKISSRNRLRAPRQPAPRFTRHSALRRLAWPFRRCSQLAGRR